MNTQRPWCVAHDRSAEFTSDFPTQRTVCFTGLGYRAAECRVEMVTLNDTECPAGWEDAWSCVVRAYAILTNEAVDVHRVAGAENELAHALRLARGEGPA